MFEHHLSRVRLLLRITFFVSMMLAMFVSTLFAAETIQSGPPVGKELPSMFHPYNVTGEDAGKERCLLCKYDAKPVALIFARDVSDSLISLVRKINIATEKYKKPGAGSFVVFLKNEDKTFNHKLRQISIRENIRHTILSTTVPEVLKGYALAPQADITVVLYVNYTVKRTFAWRRNELKETDCDVIVTGFLNLVK